MEWLTENVLPHWPFFVAMCVLWLIGHFMEGSVFTKARVMRYHPKQNGKRNFGQKLHHWFFYWMRESMELHSTCAGALIGFVWQNPEHADPAWPWAANVGYFAGAGFVSLFGWLVISKLLGRVGINADEIRLPGESIAPSAPPKDKPGS